MSGRPEAGGAKRPGAGRLGAAGGPRPGAPETTEYRRELDMERAVHTVRYRQDGFSSEQQGFATHPAGVIVWQLEAGNPRGVSGRIELSGTHGEETAPCGSGDGLQFSGRLDNGLRYHARVRALHRGGLVEAFEREGEARLRFDRVRELMLILGADTDYVPDHRRGWRGEPPEEKVAARIEAAAGKPYEELLREHVADHQRFFRRLSLELDGSTAERQRMPTGERIKAYGAHDPGLEALLFQYGRYLLIASSRRDSLPANLQGVWNQSNQPPWRSAYRMASSLISDQILPNGLDTHPPFQIDGNFGYTAGLAEMLLQSHLGEVHLLPALPRAWPSGRVRGLRARGAWEVDIEWAEGVLKAARVASRAGGDCVVRDRSRTLKRSARAGDSFTVRAADFESASSEVRR